MRCDLVREPSASKRQPMDPRPLSRNPKLVSGGPRLWRARVGIDLCMVIHVCVYCLILYTCTYVYTYVCLCVDVNTYTLYVCVYIYVCIHTRTTYCTFMPYTNTQRVCIDV